MSPKGQHGCIEGAKNAHLLHPVKNINLLDLCGEQREAETATGAKVSTTQCVHAGTRVATSSTHRNGSLYVRSGPRTFFSDFICFTSRASTFATSWHTPHLMYFTSSRLCGALVFFAAGMGL